MISQISESKLFINEPTNFELNSSFFLNKKLDGVISMYETEYNDYDVEMSDSKEGLLEKLENCFCSDCDGGIAWIPKSLSSNFIEFVQNFIVEKNTNEELNFDNGSFCESFGFHSFEDGILVEMIDPECFTEIFKECIEQFCEKEKVECSQNKDLDLTEIFTYEGCHLMSEFSNEKNKSSENGKFFALLKLKDLIV